MIAQRMRLVVRLLTIFAVVSAAPAWAGGLWLYEGAGTPDLGTATAGRAALAQDASTATANPAGMTRLDRSQMLSGIPAIIFRAEFDRKSPAVFGGGDGGNAGSALPSLSFYYVH